MLLLGKIATLDTVVAFTIAAGTTTNICMDHHLFGIVTVMDTLPTKPGVSMITRMALALERVWKALADAVDMDTVVLAVLVVMGMGVTRILNPVTGGARVLGTEEAGEKTTIMVVSAGTVVLPALALGRA